MTLAEIFLLLLIVGWYGSRLESESTGGEAPALPYAEVVAQLDRAEKALETARREGDLQRSRNAELEKILEWIGKTTGFAKPIHSLAEAEEALRKYGDRITAEAKRGKPRCRVDNILAAAIFDDGAVTVAVRQPLNSGGDSYDVGQVLSGSSDIDRFFAAIDRFYGQHRKQGKGDCVFDYTLAWRTDADYRAAQEMFEKYFYRAGIRRLK